MSILVSVVICTRNRAKLLRRALRSVCQQSLETAFYEVIVVDNGSEDETRATVDEVRGQRIASSHRPFLAMTGEQGCNVRYVFEERTGLSHARNRGWREAAGEYVAYLDDDCLAPEGWLTAAVQVIEQCAPAIFGGPYYAFYDAQKPAWFKDAYGSYEPSERAGALSSDHYLSGGNLFVRKDLLERAGGFNPQLGMAGETLAYGEETALIRWVRKNLPDTLLYYDPDLFVYHLVRVAKMSLAWQARNGFARGRSLYLTFHDEGRRLEAMHVAGFLGIVPLALLQATLGGLLRNRRNYPYYQNYFYERVLPLIVRWGKLYERLRCELFHG